jgi:hypothetical protein
MATTLKGASQLRTALRKFEPDLAVEMQTEVAALLKPIVKKARGFIPSDFTPSHWRGDTKTGKWPIYNATLMRRGIGYKTTPSKPNRRGFSYAASIHNKSAIGAIYETAGRRAAGTGKRSRPNFAQSLGRMEGAGRLQGRAMFAAWNRDQGKANAAVIKALQKAAAIFKSRKGA